MTTQTLNEDQTLAAIEAAIASGNAVELGKLMSEEQTIVQNAPVTEPIVPDPALEPVVTSNEEGEQKDKVAAATKDGSPPAPADGSTAPANNLPEWAASLPDDIKEKVLNDFGALANQSTYLEQYRKSNEGRVSTLQKQKDALQRELDSRKRVQPEPPSAAPSSPKLEEDPVLRELKETDPALYDILKKREDEVLRSTQKLVEQAKSEFNSALETKLQPFRQKQETDFQQEQQHIVLNQIPNAREVVSSEYWEMFENEAPEGVRALINSKSAQDVIAAFHLYNSWIGQNFSSPNENVPALPPVAPPQPQGNPQAQKIEEERQRKLKAGTPANRGSVTSNGAIVDFDKALEEAFQDRWKHLGYK